MPTPPPPSATTFNTLFRTLPFYYSTKLQMYMIFSSVSPGLYIYMTWSKAEQWLRYRLLKEQFLIISHKFLRVGDKFGQNKKSVEKRMIVAKMSKLQLYIFWRILCNIYLFISWYFYGGRVYAKLTTWCLNIFSYNLMSYFVRLNLPVTLKERTLVQRE